MGLFSRVRSILQKSAADTRIASERHALKLIDQGNILEDEGQLQQALRLYETAISMAPRLARAYLSRGNILLATGDLDGAMAAYTTALVHNPDYAAAHYNLGNAFAQTNQRDEAVTAYRRAIDLKPDFVDAEVALGCVLEDLGQYNEAEMAYLRALAIQPDYAEVHSNLGQTLSYLGRLDEAHASFRRALQIDPELIATYSSLLFALNYHPDKRAEDIYSTYRAFDQKFSFPFRERWRPHDNDRQTNRRLKVGYVAPVFRDISSRYFLEPLLARHDHHAVEVFAYAELLNQGDAMTLRYKQYVDCWVPTKDMNDNELAERIRMDGIDVLVDIAGHTLGNRLRVFARKPAPVSLHWLEFGYTTGVSAIDYYLTDWPTVPKGSEALFSEAPWRLDGPGLIYRAPDGMGEVSPLPAANKGYVTFGTMTRAVRINHRTIRAWADILKTVEGSQLIVDSGDFRDSECQDRLAEQFRRHGIGRERLRIGYHSPPWDVMREIDIGLDCFPHNSGTTLFETLYMGAPFVTLTGRPSVGTMGGAILCGVGHPEWIADTEDEYVRIAVRLATDLPALAALRTSLRSEMQNSPLMDEVGFARQVEHAYRQMFEIWIASTTAPTRPLHN